MYHRQQNKWYPQRCTIVQKTAEMKFGRSKQVDLYYGQVNSLPIKLSVGSKWASKHLWGTIYSAGDDA